ncbi:hypothetical protein GLW07_21860 [Bacillus hwajinpoensis]|uniref:Radical SAM protein n=1 Tax=Guptibacillus hwajinpoensis TaxID=208199 RepID=A0A845F5H3_9BACL|nr:radical SAM protein [Pseudalkalibacillus hwajinpoensis]MYL65988.1 hypothetical protein [Pseudalkalibacillus hwajinpoensis]
MLNTEKLSITFREKTIDKSQKKIRFANLKGSDQESDLTVPPNCDGYGRIRHFRRETSAGWVENPLPIDPALNSLNLPKTNVIRAQVFQTSTCNWRCWYCYVPFNLLSGDPDRSSWLTVSELIDLYLEEPDPPVVLDLSGGQPDLVPEWVPWMMKEIKRRGLQDKVYLWSDDNLSNNYFWEYLSEEEIQLIIDYKNYGRVGCFKGFDSESFTFNTNANPDLYKQQFTLMKRLINLGIDMYAYATFTSFNDDRLEYKMNSFIDNLQNIHTNLPLRTVPLEIVPFTPTRPRMNNDHERSLLIQEKAIELWRKEIEKRFPSYLRSMNVSAIDLS